MKASPFETPSNIPPIATIGEVFKAEEVDTLIRAAEELNVTCRKGHPRYDVIIADSEFGPDGQWLSEDEFRTVIQGDWLKDMDLRPLQERVQELKSEVSN